MFPRHQYSSLEYQVLISSLQFKSTLADFKETTVRKVRTKLIWQFPTFTPLQLPMIFVTLLGNQSILPRDREVSYSISQTLPLWASAPARDSNTTKFGVQFGHAFVYKGKVKRTLYTIWMPKHSSNYQEDGQRNLFSILFWLH